MPREPSISETEIRPLVLTRQYSTWVELRSWAILTLLRSSFFPQPKPGRLLPLRTQPLRSEQVPARDTGITVRTSRECCQASQQGVRHGSRFVFGTPPKELIMPQPRLPAARGETQTSSR